PATPTSRASGLTASTRSPPDPTTWRTNRYDTAHPAHRRRAQRLRRTHRDDQPGSRPGADRTRRRTEGPAARRRRRCRLRGGVLDDVELVQGRDGRDVAAFIDDSIRLGRAAYAVMHAAI